MTIDKILYRQHYGISTTFFDRTSDEPLPLQTVLTSLMVAGKSSETPSAIATINGVVAKRRDGQFVRARSVSTTAETYVPSAQYDVTRFFFLFQGTPFSLRWGICRPER